MTDGDWLTYAQAAERLNTTPEGVRQRAIRKRWQRQVGNDGLARVRLPDGVRTPAERRRANPVRTPVEQGVNERTIKALQAHIELLTQQLAASELREGQGRAELEIERARTTKAIDALSEIMARLDQLAAERGRPWWRRLAG